MPNTLFKIFVTASTPRGEFSGYLDTTEPFEKATCLKAIDQISCNELNFLSLISTSATNNYTVINLNKEILNQSVLTFNLLPVD